MQLLGSALPTASRPALPASFRGRRVPPAAPHRRHRQARTLAVSTGERAGTSSTGRSMDDAVRTIISALEEDLPLVEIKNKRHACAASHMTDTFRCSARPDPYDSPGITRVGPLRVTVVHISRATFSFPSLPPASTPRTCSSSTRSQRSAASSTTSLCSSLSGGTLTGSCVCLRNSTASVDGSESEPPLQRTDPAQVHAGCVRAGLRRVRAAQHPGGGPRRRHRLAGEGVISFDPVSAETDKAARAARCFSTPLMCGAARLRRGGKGFRPRAPPRRAAQL